MTLDLDAQLDLLIRGHRGAAESDLHNFASRQQRNLSTDRPAVLFDFGKKDWVSEDAAQLGLNLSARLTKLLGHPEGYGQSYPWRSAAWRLRYHCRREHPGHTERDEFRGALCERLVKLVILYHHSLEEACGVLGTSPDRTAQNLVKALDWISGDMDRADDDAERKEAQKAVSPEETVTEQLHRHHEVEYERRLWIRLRWTFWRKPKDRRVKLPPWKVELERRRALHRKMECPSCKLRVEEAA